MTIKCSRCGTINRIPDALEPGRIYLCAKCKKKLAVQCQLNASHEFESRVRHADRVGTIEHTQIKSIASRLIHQKSHVFLLAILIILYLALSVSNLGDRYFPHSDWVLDKNHTELVVDIGGNARVDDIFLLRHRQGYTTIDAGTIELYWGSPQSWLRADDWHVGAERNNQWEKYHLGKETRYVRLLLINISGRFAELALFSNNQKLPISQIAVDGDQTLGRPLFDEQNLVCSELSSTCYPTSYKSGSYFDEVYYVKTAEETLKLEDPTQWDHPPMSKLLIALGISVFGDNPFGWRIAGVIFGALMIPLIYLFAKRMFGSSRAGLIAAFLLTFDCMHFVQARIATPEAFLMLFVIAMFYFFYRYWQDPYRGGKYLFLSMVFFGLGFSTKWHVIYGFAGMMLLLILLKWRKPIYKREVFWFMSGVAAVVAIYMLSYVTYFLAGHDLGDFWALQLRIYDFHANLKTGHPGGSEWYTWPLMLNPVWLYGDYPAGSITYIATFGNPALWWASILVMPVTLGLAIKYRSKIAAFILIPFLTQWLFFIPISRVVFIYHFYPNVLFIILAAVLWAEWLWARYKWGKWAIAGYLILVIICFVFLWPVISGSPISEYNLLMQWVLQWISY